MRHRITNSVRTVGRPAPCEIYSLGRLRALRLVRVDTIPLRRSSEATFRQVNRPFADSASMRRCNRMLPVRWPYDRRVESVHAWGVLGLGVAVLVAVPGVYATQHAGGFRWWWPTDWMAFPLVLCVVGLALLFIPLRGPS